jgi:hypothetical protein
MLALIFFTVLAGLQLSIAAPALGDSHLESIGLNSTGEFGRRQLSGPWVIMNYKSWMCLETHGHSTASSAQVEQGTCDDTDTNAQRWDFHGVGAGYYRISSRAGAKYCLNVKGASMKSNAKVIQYLCGDPHLNDQWLPVKGTTRDGLDYYKLVNRHSHLCLNVQSASDSAGADLIQYKCDSNSHNDWFTWFPA